MPNSTAKCLEKIQISCYIFECCDMAKYCKIHDNIVRHDWVDISKITIFLEHKHTYFQIKVLLSTEAFKN